MSEFRETEAGFERDDGTPSTQAPEPERQEGQPAAVKPFQLGQRSDEDIARTLYPPAKTAEAESEKPGPEKPREPMTDAEAASVIYPDHDEKYPKHSEDGHVNDCIRDVHGRILAQGRYFGDRRALLSRSAEALPGADLRGMELSGLDLSNGNLHDSSIQGCTAQGLRARWADLEGLDARGADLSGANLGFSDLRGLQVDPDTNIANVNFEGCILDRETFDALSRCKGASSARNLAVRDVPPAKR